MTDWEAAAVELRKPLAASAIKPPPKGKFGEYVDALHVIREANRIFGEFGWSYEITRMEQTSSGIYDLTGNNGAYQQFRCSFMCCIKVHVNGVTREGAAVGMGNGKPENASDVIESAVKEAETDALKRALRSFGNTFGLALYDKDKDARQVERPDPAAGLRDAMLGSVQKAANLAALEAIGKDERFRSDLARLAEMNADMAEEVKTAARGKREALTPKAAS